MAPETAARAQKEPPQTRPLPPPTPADAVKLLALHSSLLLLLRLRAIHCIHQVRLRRELDSGWEVVEQRIAIADPEGLETRASPTNLNDGASRLHNLLTNIMAEHGVGASFILCPCIPFI